MPKQEGKPLGQNITLRIEQTIRRTVEVTIFVSEQELDEWASHQEIHNAALAEALKQKKLYTDPKASYRFDIMHRAQVTEIPS